MKYARRGAPPVAIVILLSALAVLMPASSGVRGVLPVGATGGGRSPRGPHRLYFAEGTTREGYREYVCLANPGEEQISVDVTCVLDGGGPLHFCVEIPAGSRSTLDVAGMAGDGRDVSLVLESSGRFSADRPIYFEGGDAAGSHCACAVAAPAENWYFAEGYTGNGFREYLCILNPNEEEADVVVRYYSGSGLVKEEGFSVPGLSRKTLDVAMGVGPGLEVSAVVRSGNGVPVVAERPVYFRTPSWTGGHCAAGSTLPARERLFAEGCTREGFQEYLCLFNPGVEPAAVTGEFLSSDGGTVERKWWLPPESRVTVDVNAEVGTGLDVSARLSSDVPFCAERSVYHSGLLGTDGHCSEGAPCGSRRWLFSEGTTRQGFRAFICLLNEGDAPLTGELRFLTPGDVLVAPLSVGPGSRATLDPAVYLPADTDFSLLVSAGGPFTAERVVYADATSGLRGSHCAPGDTSWERSVFGDVRSYLNTYGEYRRADLDTFRRFDVAVLDPYDYPDSRFPAALARSGTIVLAYIDIGEVEDCRSYWTEAKKHPEIMLAPNPDWPGCYHADVNNPLWRRLVTGVEIPHILSLGRADGLCMDMLDTVDIYPELEPGMVELVKEIREFYPELLLMPNRGFGVLDGVLPYIDAFKYEEMSSRYDFDRSRYVYEEDESELETLRRALSARDLPVFVLDHVRTDPPDSKMARHDFDRCGEIEEDMGGSFTWYANSVEQDHPIWPWLELR